MTVWLLRDIDWRFPKRYSTALYLKGHQSYKMSKFEVKTSKFDIL